MAMPNGGTDNCGECHFGTRLEDRRVRCQIRDIDIDEPHWTYCANNQVSNPQGIDVPVGPVYVDSGDYPYRRIAYLPSPDGLVNERLDVLEQAARGELDPRTRRLQVAVIQDLAREGAIASVPHLVDLAIAEPGELTPAGFAGPEAEMFDLSYWWESDAVRVEFVRLAALRALRQIEYEISDSDVLTDLLGRRVGADAEQILRINVAAAFVLDVQEPP